MQQPVTGYAIALSPPIANCIDQLSANGAPRYELPRVSLSPNITQCREFLSPVPHGLGIDREVLNLLICIALEDLFAHGAEGRGPAVVLKLRIRTTAVHTQRVGLIFDGACLQQTHPML